MNIHLGFARRILLRLFILDRLSPILLSVYMLFFHPYISQLNYFLFLRVHNFE